MSRFIFIIAILIFSSCSTYQESPYIPIVDRITNEHIAFAKKRSKVRVEGTGGALFKGVGSIWVGFGSDETYDVDQARRHFMILATDLVNRIESNVTIRPYLKDPDHIENAADISISYTNRKLNPNLKRPVVFVFMLKGKIHYCANAKNHSGFDDLHSETYFEALEIIRRENEDLKVE